MKTTRLESETVIIWNDAEPDAIITTRSATTKRRMERKGYKFKELAKGCDTWRSMVPKRLCLPRALRSKTTPNTGVTQKKAATS